MQNRALFLIPLLSLMISCVQSGRQESEGSGNHYAKGFSRIRQKEYCRLSVRNPWEKARNVEINYYLVGKEAQIPDSISGENIIRIPVERVICLSTSHVGYLEALGETDKVTGVSGEAYLMNPLIRERIASGETMDVGYGQNLNYEEIIRQKPDMVMVYGVDNEITGFLDKFRDLGIPSVLIGEYLEETPLGKAEWIKFIAPFFDKQQLADSLFTETEKRYLDLAGKVAHVAETPTVMVGLPYRDNWWIPGGNSYLARLITDAGGHYVGKENDSHESFVISMEEAFVRASRADFWLNVGMVTRKEEILESDARFGGFGLFRDGKIFNNNKRATPGGGNDFWESGTIHPDLILEDLIRIFHPGVLPDDEFHYYREVR